MRELRQLRRQPSNARYDRACADDPFLVCLRIKEKLGLSCWRDLAHQKRFAAAKISGIQQLGLDQLSTYGLMREIVSGTDPHTDRYPHAGRAAASQSASFNIGACRRCVCGLVWQKESVHGRSVWNLVQDMMKAVQKHLRCILR